jgi:acetylornithine/N-succinyldiaminopimelate aminotransferase
MAPAPASASQSVLVPTYARAPVAFERGEGPWAITADGTAISISAPASRSTRSATHPHLVKTR